MAIKLYREAHADTTVIQSGYGRSPVTFSNYAFMLWLLGYPDQARAKVAEAIAIAEKLRDPMQISIAQFFATLLYRYMNIVEQVAVLAEDLLGLDRQYTIIVSRLSGLITRGWVLARHGAPQEGIAQMRAGIDGFKRLNHTMFQTHRLAWLAEAQMRAGQWHVAAATLDEGFAMSDSSGQRSCDAELLRLCGELFMQADAASLQVITPGAATDRQAAAEDLFWQAIKIARTQEAKSFELRAVMSLCRLWRQQGRQAEAYNLLSELYNWFTEGFETHDLQEARSLLAQLVS
jgi:predicted ATPase